MYTVKQLKNDIRHPYAWPGGYEIAFITSEGEILCHECVHREFRNVIWSMKNQCDDGWRIVATTYEAVDSESTRESAGDNYISYCAHCGKEFGEFGA